MFAPFFRGKNPWKTPLGGTTMAALIPKKNFKIWENVDLFRGQRSKVKVTRPINAHTVNVQYLPKRKAYELQTWYTDGIRGAALPTSAVTSKVKGQGRKVTWRVWHVLADKSRTKRPRNTKICRKVVHPMCNNAHEFQVKVKVKGQGHQAD